MNAVRRPHVEVLWRPDVVINGLVNGRGDYSLLQDANLSADLCDLLSCPRPMFRSVSDTHPLCCPKGRGDYIGPS